MTWCSSLPGHGLRVLVAVLALALVVVGAHGAHAEPQPPREQGDVLRARARVDTANDRVEELRRALDANAAGYEKANAHRIRVQDELAAADVRMERAAHAVVAAEDVLAERVAAAYKHPRGDFTAAGAIFAAPDAPSALHAAGLYRRLAARSADDVKHVRWAGELTAADVRSEHVIAAGAKASVDEWRRQADALTASLAAAQRAATAADGQLADAVEEAERRAEAARQTQALVTTTGAAPAGAPPAVNGKVCPVGSPNGFIDSWGFPRSGGRTHQGVDMFAAYGTPLYAVADGHIYRVYTNPLGGLAINLIDSDGNMYYYAHLASATAVTGQTVRAGDMIGTVGTSGNAAGTPPHLHWQFHPGNGAPVNPYPLAYALCR